MRKTWALVMLISIGATDQQTIVKHGLSLDTCWTQALKVKASKRQFGNVVVWQSFSCERER